MKTQIEITVRLKNHTKFSKHTVTAEVFGAFAVHREFDQRTENMQGKGWTVTHIPTGCVPTPRNAYHLKREAVAIAKALMPFATRLENHAGDKTLGSEIIKAVGEAVRTAQDKPETTNELGYIEAPSHDSGMMYDQPAMPTASEATVDIDGTTYKLGVQPTPDDPRIFKGTVAEFFDSAVARFNKPDFAEYDSYRDMVDRTCEYCDKLRAETTCVECGGCVNCCQCRKLATFQMDAVSWRQAVYAASYVQNQGYILDSDRMVLWKRVSDFGTAYICDHDGLHFVILYDVQDCHSLAIEALVKHRDGLEDGIAYELVQRARVANGSAYPANTTRNINPQGQFSAFRSSARG